MGLSIFVRTRLLPKLKVPLSMWLIYAGIYACCGFLMNRIGIELQIARFLYGWQIFTVYVLYMVPVSLLLRKLPFHGQYAYGFVAMGLLEFGGYALETSFAYPDNVLDKYFGIRNFSLSMALFFALYFPAGNALVGYVYQKFFGKNRPATKEFQ